MSGASLDESRRARVVVTLLLGSLAGLLAAVAACTTFSTSDDPTERDSALEMLAPPGDAAPPPSDATDAGANALHCGQERCAPRTEVCCATDAGAPRCADQAACDGRKYACTEAANCAAFGAPGEARCCLIIDKDQVLGSECTSDPSCRKTFHDLLCLRGDGYPCPDGGECTATQAYPDLPSAEHCAGYPRVGP